MKTIKTKAWLQYEAGLRYKQRVGLYETVRRNERFYRGNQWYGAEGAEIPKPVFNIIRRIVDYLVCSISPGSVSLSFTDENLPFVRDRDTAALIRRATELLSKHASYRWEQNKMDFKVYSLLHDAALSGDGVFYCWWDPSAGSGQEYTGDIVTGLVDNTNLFVADVNRADIQSQDYIILSGRESVATLREQARRYGVPQEEIAKIVPDTKAKNQSGDLGEHELLADDESERKATCIVKFWREEGFVVFEKSTEGVVVRRQRTNMTLYPVAYMNWYPTKNSFHGTSPITGLIPNQKFINRAFAMVMKHMTDTAFSKVVYDKSRIPEWSNEVGQAIAVLGGTNVADAVSVVGVGKLQEGYLELIELAVAMTKELMGATETALGDGEAINTSAILALQEAARIPLDQVRRSLCRCIEDLANIWVDMMCAYYPDERLLPYIEEGTERAERISFSLLKGALLRARVDVGEFRRYGAAGMMSLLNKLLEGGHITPGQYIERLPPGLLADRALLLEELKATKNTGREERAFE
jgi:hypothetical protein